MGKKFGMKNLVGAMMALSALNVGGAVSYAAKPDSVTSSSVENIELFGGDFGSGEGPKRTVVGRKKARTAAKNTIEKEILGLRTKTVISDDVELRALEYAIFRAAVRGCSKDCIGVSEETKDTRYMWQRVGAANPDSDLEYTILWDTNAIPSVKENYPKILEVVRNCVTAIKKEGEGGTKRGDATITSAVERFKGATSRLDELLSSIPSVTEGSLRLIIQNSFFADSLEKSLLGRNFELDGLSAEVANYVKREFDQIKEKWTNRTEKLVEKLEKEKHITRDYLMHGKQKNRQTKKSTN